MTGRCEPRSLSSCHPMWQYSMRFYWCQLPCLCLFLDCILVPSLRFPSEGSARRWVMGERGGPPHPLFSTLMPDPISRSSHPRAQCSEGPAGGPAVRKGSVKPCLQGPSLRPPHIWDCTGTSASRWCSPALLASLAQLLHARALHSHAV